MNIERLLGSMSRERTWVAAAIVGGSAITAGAGIYSASQNGGAPGIVQQYTPGPDAAIGQKAAGQWADQLTQDQTDPNWGAISPDWNDIWQQTQQQVHNYFNGTATNPGVNDQINASFAQRGMSGDPAASFLQSQSGANEAQMLNNNSANMNIAKQTFTNQGKSQWLNSMAQFQHETMPAQGTDSYPYATTGQQIGNAIGAAGSGIAAYGLQQQSNKDQMSWLNSILNHNPTSYAPSTTGSPTTGSPTTANWVSGAGYNPGF